MFSRREFLTSSGIAVASLAASPLFAGRASETSDATRRALVVMELSGGNDALNTLIPVDDDNYYAARPTIAIPPHRGLMIDGHVALHPAMPEMRDLFRRGQLAIIQGVGYPNSSRSHLRAMEAWHRGAPDCPVATGWLGRWWDNVGHSASRRLSPMLHFANRRAELFAATRSPGVLVTESGPFTVGPRSVTVGPACPAVESAMVHPRKPNADYPECRLGRAMALFAQLIADDVGTRLFYVNQAGFDTHVEQAETHAEVLGQVSASIGAFMSDLRSEKLDGRVLVMVISEFGRRLGENGRGGTDHGAAGLMFFAGGAVRGGFYGTYPSLTDLDDGSLMHSTDFRDCYATVLERWLGVEATEIIGHHHGPVAFL